MAPNISSAFENELSDQLRFNIKLFFPNQCTSGHGLSIWNHAQQQTQAYSVKTQQREYFRGNHESNYADRMVGREAKIWQ